MVLKVSLPYIVFQRNETAQSIYYKECMKQDSPNVLICPNNENLKIENRNQTIITKLLKDVQKEMKKKKKKKKIASRRRKMKKCIRMSNNSQGKTSYIKMLCWLTRIMTVHDIRQMYQHCCQTPGRLGVNLTFLKKQQSQ